MQGEDYNMSSTVINQRLQGISKFFSSNQQAHYMPSSSVGTMIPTPGMTSYGNKGLPVSSQDNTMMSNNGGGMMAQNTVNVGNILPNTNGPVGMGQIASFNASIGITPVQLFFLKIFDVMLQFSAITSFF